MAHVAERVSFETHNSRCERRSESVAASLDFYVTSRRLPQQFAFGYNYILVHRIVSVAATDRTRLRCMSPVTPGRRQRRGSATISKHASRRNVRGHVTVHRLHGRAHPFVIGRQLTGNGSLVAHAPTSGKISCPVHGPVDNCVPVR
jgi:hypothetical protein